MGMSIKFDLIGDNEPDIRMLYDIKDVVHDLEWLKSTPDKELYYMYRDLYHNEEEHLIIQNNQLRYDITVIPPYIMGNEYVKTAGHYHPSVPDTKITYPEVYQILEGKATYILQKRVDDYFDKVIEDNIQINAHQGDVVIVPPGYGHVTLNRSTTTLRMANWVCSQFSSIYEPYRRCRGATYYFLVDGIVKNNEYEQIPELRTEKPGKLREFGLIPGKDMYELVNEIDKLEFLTKPQNHTELFSSLYKQ